jgi:hypothetical protein
MPELFIAGSASVTSNEEPLQPQKKSAEGNDSFSKLLESGVEETKKSVELQEDSVISAVSGDNREVTEAAVDASDVVSLVPGDVDDVNLIKPYIGSPDENSGRQKLPPAGDFLPQTGGVAHAAPLARPLLEAEATPAELTIKDIDPAVGSSLNAERTIPELTLNGSSPEGAANAVGTARLDTSSMSKPVPSIEATLRETLPVEGRMATSSLQPKSRVDEPVLNSANFAVPTERSAGVQPIPGLMGQMAGKTLGADKYEPGARELALSSRFLSAGPPMQPSEPKSVIKAIRETSLNDLPVVGTRGWLSSGDQGRIQVERAIGSIEQSLPVPPAIGRSQLNMAAPVLADAAMLESPTVLPQQAAPALSHAAMFESPTALTQQIASASPHAAMFESPTALAQQTAPALVTALKSPFTVPNTQVWVGEMREKIDMVLASQRNEIELKLSPANLGKIEVLIRRDDDQTALTFFVKNPEVRETLEQGLARLHRNLSEQGLTMGDTTVSDQTLDEHRDSESVRALPDESSEEVANSLHSDLPGSTAVTSTPIGLVNTWA